MKPKPPCPRCGLTTLVKTSCGSSKGLYAYVCYGHDAPVEWNQVPPHQINSGDSSRVRMKKTKDGSARQYRCGKCGVAPKKGHVCLGSRPPSNAAPMGPPSSSHPPLSQPNDYEMDEDEDDALPPPPPALLQLRPLSEVSKRITGAL